MLKFNLYGKEFIVSEERAAYNEVRQIYSDLSNEALDKFYDIYTKENKNLTDVYNNIDKQGDIAMEKLIKESIEILNIYGITDMDEEEFYKEYKKSLRYSFWDDAKHDIKEKYIEIELGEEELEEYKKRRRERRGQIKEETFDIEKYKGLEKNEKEDKDKGLGKKIFDTLGDKVNEGIASLEKMSIFKDEDTISSLLNGFYSTCYFMHYTLIEIIEDRAGKEYSWVPEVDQDFVNKKLSRSKKLKLDDDEKKNNIVEMLDKSPYNKDIYIYAFDEFKDPEGELKRVSEFFGINIDDYKEEHLKEYFNQINLKLDAREIESSLPRPKKFLGLVDTVDDELREKGYIWMPLRLELIERLRLYIIKWEVYRYSQSIYLDSNNIVMNEINQIIKESYDEFMMVNGIKYSHYDNALKARIEREEIEKKLRKMEISEDGILKTIDQVDKFSTKVKKSYIKKLKDDLNIYIDLLIDSEVSKNDFESIEDMEKMIEDIKSKYGKYNVSKKHIDRIYGKIDEFIDDEIKTLIDRTDLEDIQDIENLIVYIDDNYDNEIKERHINKLEGDILIIKGKQKAGEIVDKGKNLVKGLFGNVLGKKDEETKVISEEEIEEIDDEDIIEVKEDKD